MSDDLDDLQKQWTHLYRDHLPGLAKAKEAVQSSWPVNLDHCFARIVLDNAVGVNKPWTEIVKQPAVRNMSAEQLRNAIDLAERIATGEADLVELNDRSLDLRGKNKRKRKEEPGSKQTFQEKKRKVDGTVSSYFLPSPTSPKKGSKEKREEDAKAAPEKPDENELTDRQAEIDMSAQLQRIEDSNLTPFRKQALKLLCQIPRGRYSTYQALSDYITKTSHKTCARAVGSAMRNNPFAPEVPCHRVLANDGSLGGFGGHWGEDGKFANKKHRILDEEGVRFDSRGKVKGPPFREFAA